MKVIQLRPKLKDLSQGSRIAFVRRFRFVTQDYVSDKLGLTGDCKRRTMTRYEKGARNPTEERTKKIADILNVSYDSIRKYDLSNPLDIIFILMWMEELYPDFGFKMTLSKKYYNEIIRKVIKDWTRMKNKLNSKEIKYEEYLEWKLNYRIDESRE